MWLRPAGRTFGRSPVATVRWTRSLSTEKAEGGDSKNGNNGNSGSAAAEVIYKNPEAIQNRMQLFHLMRLQTQEKLDRQSLRGTELRQTTLTPL